MLTPQTNGSPVRSCIPIAMPKTSARSHAAIATSASKYKIKLMPFGYVSRFACARSLPRTMPSRADNPCNNNAIRLLINNTQIKA